MLSDIWVKWGGGGGGREEGNLSSLPSHQQGIGIKVIPLSWAISFFFWSLSL